VRNVRLTVVMPVYNEAATLATVLEDVRRNILDVVENSELVVIDDRSTDETPAILAATHDFGQRMRVLTNEPNRGHGPSVRRGIDESTGEWILHIDSDGQIELAEFSALWALAKDHDLILGVRAERHDPTHRLVLTRVTRLMASVMARRRVTDANTPFKLIRRSLFDHLSPTIHPNAFAPSILVVIGAHRSGARVGELAITHLERPHGRSTLRVGRLARAAVLSAFQTILFSVRRIPKYPVEAST
jgi:dolichol-phosphate mannosyltransferase